MTATAETTKTFPTRTIVATHQLDQLAVGAYFLDGFGRGGVKTDEHWYKLDDHEFEINAVAIALPAEVLDEGDVPFQPGDRVSVVNSPYTEAVKHGARGTVVRYNGLFWMVELDDQLAPDLWPFSSGEIEKVTFPALTPEVGAKVSITSTLWDKSGSAIRFGLEGVIKNVPNEETPYFDVHFDEYGGVFLLREHEFKVIASAPYVIEFPLSEINHELLNLIFGAPLLAAPAVDQVLETVDEINALPNGTVLVTEAKGLRIVQLP